MVPVLTFQFPIVGVLIIFDTIFCLFSNSLIFLQEVVKCRWWDNCIQCCICDISSIWYAVITVPLDLNFMLCYIIGPVSFAVSSWVGGGRFLHIIATDFLWSVPLQLLPLRSWKGCCYIFIQTTDLFCLTVLTNPPKSLLSNPCMLSAKMNE